MGISRTWTPRTTRDVAAFFKHYYAPNNAVMAIAGDVSAAEVFARVEKYFGGIAPRQVPPKPDTDEAPQTAERRLTEQDTLARVPALAIGYRMPPHHSHDAVVGALVGELLHNGQASLLYQALVKDKKVALEVSGGVNFVFGTPLEYDGPTLLTSFILYPPNLKEDDVLSAYDAVMSGLASRRAQPGGARPHQRQDAVRLVFEPGSSPGPRFPAIARHAARWQPGDASTKSPQNWPASPRRRSAPSPPSTW